MQAYLSHRTGHILAWDDAVLGSCEGFVYGGTLEAVFTGETDSTVEEIIAFKASAQPTGVRAMLAWGENGYCSALPDSEFAAHVLEVNLTRLAREGERIRAGILSPSSVMKIFYSSPSQNVGVEYTLPPR